MKDLLQKNVAECNHETVATKRGGCFYDIIKYYIKWGYFYDFYKFAVG